MEIFSLSPNPKFKISEQLLTELSTALQTQGWFTSSQLVPSPICHQLLKQLQKHHEAKTLKKAGIGQGSLQQVLSGVRGDFIRWLDEQSPTALESDFFTWLESLKNSLNEQLYLGLQSSEVHYVVYPPSSGYDKHLDVFKSDSRRLLSFVLYLNEKWLEEWGGELLIFKEDDPNHLEIKILPLFSQCAIFLSGKIYHQVNFTTRTRFSVTGWLK
jgi:SM-20-related protein